MQRSTAFAASSFGVVRHGSEVGRICWADEVPWRRRREGRGGGFIRTPHLLRHGEEEPWTDTWGSGIV
jgi:hypothetical protein